MTDKLTITQACEMMNVSRRTVQRWIARGLIKTTRDPECGPKAPHKITAADLAAFVPPKATGRPRKKRITFV